MNKLNKKHEQGFSLIELLVVIGIIGVLASIAVPQFSSLREKAFDAAAISDLKQIKLMQELFRNEGGPYAPFTIDDKVSGSLSVVVDGKIFSVPSLSANVEILCKTDAAGNNLIIAARHTGSSVIIAIDSNASESWRKLSNQVALTDALVPASTAGDDLAGWATL
ncbi:MAG: prepilin-type N-terminal cleavage/methylation domain-containing protein [Mariprofundaceae bacterium]|nr:prepilin-type N-terminal cleavage/methylation domain-containing protein [Mariprofundaceae bacterium]